MTTAHLSVFFFASLFLSIVSLLLIILLHRYGNQKIHQLWKYFNCSVFLWGIGAVLIGYGTYFNKNNIVYTTWRITDCIVTFIPILLLHSSLEFTKRKNFIFLKLSYLLGIISNILIINTDLIISYNLNLYGNFLLFFSPGKLFYFWVTFWIITASFANYYLITYLRDQKNGCNIKFFVSTIALGSISGSINFFYAFNPPLLAYANLGIVVYSLTCTYMIFRHNLFDINIIFQKGLIYSILITIFTGIYLIIIFSMEWLFRGIIGYKSLYLSLISAFILTLLFNPIRDKIQKLIDKLFFRKTTQEFAHENELLKQELERSDRLKTASTLALGLAHEIKNPLTTIKTFAEFLPEKFKDEDFVNKFSKLIPSEVERINNIIHQLLDFSKPIPPSFRDTNIHHLINDILVFFNSEFLKRRIRISEAYSDSTLIIRIDPSQIKQALLNIILNGIDAMPRGGNIAFRTLIDNKYFKIYISDSGRGIAKGDLKHVFDPFFSTKDEGTGLGLSVTHQIIKNHKGIIEVQSEIGKGTTFILSLPLTQNINAS